MLPIGGQGGGFLWEEPFPSFGLQGVAVIFEAVHRGFGRPWPAFFSIDISERIDKQDSQKNH